MIRLRIALVATLAAVLPIEAQQLQDCNRPTANPVVHIAVTGSPFEPLPSADGCWIFVTLASPQSPGHGSVAVLHRTAGRITIARTIPIKGAPTGAVLTHDGTTMIVAAGNMLAFLDVARMESGSGEAVTGYLDTGEPVGLIYANLKTDDRWLFVSAERAAAIGILDMNRIRAGHMDTTAIVGKIETGNAPVGLEFSKDQRYLYTTAQSAPAAWQWPNACKPENQPNAWLNHPQGAIVVIDVAAALTKPDSAVVSRVAAGCNPVRLVLSPDGSRAYVSARGEHNLLAFDTGKLTTDTAHARFGRVPAGTAPVGVAVFDSGRKIVVTSSNRFGGAGANEKQSLIVIDATRITSGMSAVIGSIPAGAFARELRVTADGKTLIVTNFNSKTVQFVDLTRLPLSK